MFNTVIMGWCAMANPEQGFMVLEDLRAAGLQPNAATYAGSHSADKKRGIPGDASLISSFAQYTTERSTVALLMDAEKSGIVHIDLYNAAIRGYCRARKFTEARNMIRCPPPKQYAAVRHPGPEPGHCVVWRTPSPRDVQERPYTAGGGGGGVPPLWTPPSSPVPLPMPEADSQNFASAPSVPRGFGLQKFWPAFCGDHRGTLGGGGVTAKPPPPPLLHPCPTPPPPRGGGETGMPEQQTPHASCPQALHIQSGVGPWVWHHQDQHQHQPPPPP